MVRRWLAILGLSVAASFVLGSPSAQAAGVVDQAGSPWVSAKLLGPGASGGARSVLSPGSVRLPSAWLSPSFMPLSLVLSGLASSEYPYPLCPESEYTGSPWSPGSPVSPVPSCAPESYPVPVVLALVEIRDLIAFGFGVLTILSASTMVLIWSRSR